MAIMQKLQLHFHFGAHISASHFKQAKGAFEKFGPFDVFSSEHAASRQINYKRANIEQNKELAQFRRLPKKTKQEIFSPDENYDSALFNFLLSKNIISAPLESYSQNAIKRNMRIRKALFPKKIEHLKYFSFDDMLARDFDILSCMFDYYGRLKPILEKFSPSLLKKEILRAFCCLGANHLLLAHLAKKRAEGTAISISQSFSYPAHKKLFDKYAHISEENFRLFYKDIAVDIFRTVKEAGL
ncbi:hypothetical protein COU37_03820 [Candidatus Micrarchaeota archaeon CG10_big_fil_rev_8_21_14_0_10_45_29]|nr:MAG: hypothetical protein COU37_03820 [Candidatus Micrarchaeota archaeon CG10_big_fil_rev_8_21_14_0_10_45_29]